MMKRLLISPFPLWISTIDNDYEGIRANVGVQVGMISECRGSTRGGCRGTGMIAIRWKQFSHCLTIGEAKIVSLTKI